MKKKCMLPQKGKLAGILHISSQSFLLNGWNEDAVPVIYLLEESKNIIPLIHLVDALFLNGMVSIDSHISLINDSYGGCIWKYDKNANQADIWLKHPLLSRTDESSSMPAANGIKVFGDVVFVSNTEKQLLLKIPLIDKKAGIPGVFINDLNLDDAIDREENIYAATHIYNSVVKITREKKVTIIAEASRGVAGSTAVAFGRREDDKNSIYVTTYTSQYRDTLISKIIYGFDVAGFNKQFVMRYHPRCYNDLFGHAFFSQKFSVWLFNSKPV